MDRQRRDADAAHRGASKAQPAPPFMDRSVMNTGIRIFFGNTVGWDLKRGQVVITPDAGASQSHC